MIDKPVVAARIFYGDGSVVDLAPTTDWKNVPKTGVQVVCLKYNDGTSRIMMGHDYYWRTARDDYDTGDDLAGVPTRASRIDGGWVSDAAFLSTAKAALMWLGISAAQAETAVTV